MRFHIEKKLTPVFIAGAIAISAGLAFAQGQMGHEGSGGHMGHGGDTTAESNASANEATRGYQAANDRMHKDMAIEYTGNADVDFMRSMIPHHQGAIDMARVVVEHGSDPEVRKLAEDVISAQEAEIKIMREWLAKHGY